LKKRSFIDHFALLADEGQEKHFIRTGSIWYVRRAVFRRLQGRGGWRRRIPIRTGVDMERTVRTPDGRILAVQEAGDPAGSPVLVHNGTPMSRHLYGPNAADAAEQGLRLISYDRPGYGGSTPQPGRSVADAAADVRAICAALEIGRLAMWGLSGGGPRVLACAALLPDLVTAAAALASFAPYDAEGLDWFDGLQAADAYRRALTDPDAVRAGLDEARKDELATTASSLVQDWAPMLSAPDAAVLTGELAEFTVRTNHEAIAPGSQGWWDDSYGLIRPWGCDLADISVPVLLLHGRQDKFIPVTHAQWLAAHIPGVEARLLEDDGHLTLQAHRVSEVHSWLKQRL
jgi:pimeloyl-ACP methyl ester carboxylesterase